MLIKNRTPDRQFLQMLYCLSISKSACITDFSNKLWSVHFFNAIHCHYCIQAVIKLFCPFLCEWLTQFQEKVYPFLVIFWIMIRCFKELVNSEKNRISQRDKVVLHLSLNLDCLIVCTTCSAVLKSYSVHRQEHILQV